MLERWLLLWLCLLSGVAYLWPFAGPFDPFLLTKPWLSQIFVLPMFALGWLLPADEVRQVARRWPLVAGGTAIQYISMPLLAWAIANSLPLSAEIRTGIIMVGCVPGAMASNVLTLMARGNASYSLSLTTLSTCLSPILVPLILRLMLNRQMDQSLLDLVIQLSWMVLLPVVAGHLMGRRYPSFKPHLDPWCRQVAALAILWIIAVVVGANRHQPGQWGGAVLVAVVMLNLLGYLAGHGGSRLLQLDQPMRRALILEVGMQNAGLGTTLAAKFFEDQPEAMIPTALYTFGCMLSGTVLAWYWRTQTESACGP